MYGCPPDGSFLWVLGWQMLRPGFTSEWTWMSGTGGGMGLGLLSLRLWLLCEQWISMLPRAPRWWSWCGTCWGLGLMLSFQCFFWLAGPDVMAVVGSAVVLGDVSWHSDQMAGPSELVYVDGGGNVSHFQRLSSKLIHRIFRGHLRRQGSEVGHRWPSVNSTT